MAAGERFSVLSGAGQINRSAPKTPGNLPLSAAVDLAESRTPKGTGGGSASGDEPSPSLAKRSATSWPAPHAERLIGKNGFHIPLDARAAQLDTNLRRAAYGSRGSREPGPVHRSIEGA